MLPSCTAPRANTAASYRRKNMMHGAPRSVSSSFLAERTVANACEPDYAPCVRARLIPHTCEIEIFFSGHITEVTYGNNLLQADLRFEISTSWKTEKMDMNLEKTWVLY